MNCEDHVQKRAAEDWPFLAEIGYPYSSMLSGLLIPNGIPFLTKENTGAGMALKFGPLLERSRFYVPASCFELASQLLDEISGEN